MLLDSNLHIDGDGLNEAHFSQIWQKNVQGVLEKGEGNVRFAQEVLLFTLLNSDKYVNWPFKSVKTAYLMNSKLLRSFSKFAQLKDSL